MVGFDDKFVLIFTTVIECNALYSVKLLWKKKEGMKRILPVELIVDHVMFVYTIVVMTKHTHFSPSFFHILSACSVLPCPSAISSRYPPSSSSCFSCAPSLHSHPLLYTVIHLMTVINQIQIKFDVHSVRFPGLLEFSCLSVLLLDVTF